MERPRSFAPTTDAGGSTSAPPRARPASTGGSTCSRQTTPPTSPTPRREPSSRATSTPASRTRSCSASTAAGGLDLLHPLDEPDEEDRMTTAYATSADGLEWEVARHRPRPRGPEPGTRGARESPRSSSDGRVAYDGRASKEENWFERIGLAQLGRTTPSSRRPTTRSTTRATSTSSPPGRRLPHLVRSAATGREPRAPHRALAVPAGEPRPHLEPGCTQSVTRRATSVTRKTWPKQRLEHGQRLRQPDRGREVAEPERRQRDEAEVEVLRLRCGPAARRTARCGARSPPDRGTRTAARRARRRKARRARSPA